jgi:hypothetical protein
MISVGDRLLSVENLSLHKMKKDDIKAIVHGFLHEKYRENITLEVESHTKTAVWYNCPYCSKDNKITEQEVTALKATREQIVADHDSFALKARLLQECLSQPPDNHLKAQVESNCGKNHIMEYHFTRKLLCICRNCQFPSSASNLFHLNLFD